VAVEACLLDGLAVGVGAIQVFPFPSKTVSFEGETVVLLIEQNDECTGQSRLNAIYLLLL
jgi:hypothetical protein